LIFRKLAVGLAIVFLFSLPGFGSEIGKVYHIKFEWKTEKSVTAFYEMTTQIYEAMGIKREVLFYTEYGNLEDIYLWLLEDESYAKMESVISLAKNKYVEAVIDPVSTMRTPLHKMFSGETSGNNEAVCEIRKTMEFIDKDDAWAYLLKMQDLILRRGHLMSMFYKGKTQKEFEVIFDFYGDCIAKDAIVSELLKIIPENDPH